MKKFLLFFFSGMAIQANAQCPVTITGGGTICQGSCVALQASGASTYSWTPGGFTGASMMVCPSVTTIYTVTGTLGGCTSSETVAVYVSPSLSVSIASTAPTCGMCDGSATVSVTGGSAPYQFTWSSLGVQPAVVQNMCAGTYSCVVTDAAGCTVSASLALSNTAGPNATFTMTPSGTPQVWNAAAAYSGGTPPYGYDWDWGDGSAHDTTAYPSHTYNTAGWYTICLTLTDANACVSFSCQNDSLYKMSAAMITVNVVNTSAGIQAVSKPALQFSYFPNPAHNEVRVQTSPAREATFNLYDLSGRLLMTRSLAGRLTLDVSQLSEGIYTLSCRVGTEVISKKLVIIR